MNQWKDTSTFIKRFNSLNEKNKCSFLQFDIAESYPSISVELLSKSINHARRYSTISEEDTEIILQSRKSLLFSIEEHWIKRNDNEMFDVTMGSYDGAEICELVGLLILYRLGQLFNNANNELYRDDGLACFHAISGPQADSIRKLFINTFKKEFGLKITIETNLKIVNFLDITLNLTSAKYQPYTKPNDSPLYINAHSNHPKNILKSIPENISSRINNLSSDENIFNSSKDLYNNALLKSGFKTKIVYKNKNQTGPNPRNRKRKIIWFNPPYCMSVSTNVAGSFLRLIKKHFPKNHRLHKNFNKNNVKVSYSCLPNMSNIIKSHNRKILTTENTEPSTAACNCQKKQQCPLNGNCLQKNVIYQCVVSSDQSEEKSCYIGCTENTFKDRLYKHRNSFKYESKANATELSKHIWENKNSSIPTVNTWSIIDQARPYVNGSNRCNLCISEKFHIIFSPLKLLNKRSELVTKCRHENKFILKNYKDIARRTVG